MRKQITTLKFRIPILFKSIESHSEINKMPVGDLLELATVFLQFLNIPDFLFNRLIDRIESSPIESINKKTLRKFVTTLMNRHEIRYTYDVFNTDEFDYNSKWTNSTLELLRRLIVKIKKSTSLTLQLLGLAIVANKELLHALIPILSQRVGYLDGVMKSFLAYLTNANKHPGFSNLKDLLSVIATEGQHLNSSQTVVILDKLFTLVLNQVQAAPLSSESIVHIAEYLAAVVEVNKSIGLTPNNKNVIEGILRSLNKLFVHSVLPGIISKCNTLILEVTYDKEVKQRFNPNIYNSDFAGMEHLPMILSNLKVELDANLKQSLQPIFERTCKRWSGVELIQNINYLSSHSLLNSNICLSILPGLLSVFDYYPSINKLILPSDHSPKDIISAIKSIISILSTNNIKGKKYRFHPLIGLNLLCTQFFDQLEESTLLSLMGICGEYYSNYDYQFINKVKNYKFQSFKTLDERANVLSSVPPLIPVEGIHREIERNVGEYYGHRSFEEILRNRHIVLTDVKDIEPSLGYIRHFSRYLPDSLTAAQFSNFINFGLKNATNPENKDDLLLFYISFMTLGRPEEIKKVAKETTDSIKKLAKDVLRSRDYGVYKVVVEDETGKQVEIEYNPSQSIDEDPALSQISDSNFEVKLTPRAFMPPSPLTPTSTPQVQFNAEAVLTKCNKMKLAELYSDVSREVIIKCIIHEYFTRQAKSKDYPINQR